MSTTTTFKPGGRFARYLAALIVALLAVAGGVSVTLQDTGEPPPPTTTTTVASVPAGTTAAPVGLARFGPSSRTAVKGCPRPNVPPKDAKALADVAEPLRSYLHTAIIDARAVGKSIYLVSGGRSDGQQWDLRHDRVPAGQECNPAYKGHPTTAIPGRSRHRNTGAYENGKLVAAADMGGDLRWLHDHAADYGIHFPVRGEYWHAEVTGRPPLRPIIPFYAPVARWVPFGVGETDLSIARRGGLGNQVLEVQLILKHLGYLTGRVDGRYGPVSGAAMSRFKKDIVKIQRATGQPVWPSTDPYVGPRTIDMLRWWNR